MEVNELAYHASTDLRTFFRNVLHGAFESILNWDYELLSPCELLLLIKNLYI